MKIKPRLSPKDLLVFEYFKSQFASLKIMKKLFILFPFELYRASLRGWGSSDADIDAEESVLVDLLNKVSVNKRDLFSQEPATDLFSFFEFIVNPKVFGRPYVNHDMEHSEVAVLFF
jgi:hypothetical protein